MLQKLAIFFALRQITQFLVLRKAKIKKSLRQVLQLQLDCRTVQETTNDLLAQFEVEPNYMHCT